MRAKADLEQRLADHYAQAAPEHAPDRVLLETLSSIEITRQRRSLAGTAGRIQLMNTLMKAAVAAVVILIVGAVGVAILIRPGGVASDGRGQSSAPSGPSPSADRGSAAPPALTQAYTSAFNGFSISYPGDWKVTAATQSWPTGSANFSPDDASVDGFNGANLALYATSQKIKAGTTASQWVDQYMSDSRLDFSNRPDCAVEKVQPIVVDGAAGLMNYSCGAVLIDAIVTSGGRAYVFSLQGDSPDRAWLLEVLKTVKLAPASAVDAQPAGSPDRPSARPSGAT